MKDFIIKTCVAVICIASFLFLTGCSESSKRILGADITGEKYTVIINRVSYKTNHYSIRGGVLTFVSYSGHKYKTNTWTVKETKED